MSEQEIDPLKEGESDVVELASGAFSAGAGGRKSKRRLKRVVKRPLHGFLEEEMRQIQMNNFTFTEREQWLINVHRKANSKENARTKDVQPR